MTEDITGLSGLSPGCHACNDGKRVIRVIRRRRHGQANDQRGAIVERAWGQNQEGMNVPHLPSLLRVAVDPDDVLPIRNPGGVTLRRHIRNARFPEAPRQTWLPHHAGQGRSAPGALPVSTSGSEQASTRSCRLRQPPRPADRPTGLPPVQCWQADAHPGYFPSAGYSRSCSWNSPQNRCINIVYTSRQTGDKGSMSSSSRTAETCKYGTSRMPPPERQRPPPDTRAAAVRSTQGRIMFVHDPAWEGS